MSVKYPSPPAWLTLLLPGVWARLSTVHVAEVTITPEAAQELLRRGNEGNRPLRPGDADLLRRIIGSGQWAMTGEAITIAANGRLLNGQHRLTACARSGRPICSLVVFGPDPAEMAKRRQREGQERGRQTQKGFPAPVPETIDPGDARDKVGEALGIGGKTVEALVECVGAIDRLEAQGKAREAEAVKAELNQRGAKAGARAAREALAAEPPPTAPPPTASSALPSREPFSRARAALAALRAAMQEAADSEGGAALREACDCTARAFTCKELRSLASILFSAAPHAAGCCICPGDDRACRVCRGRGWVTRGAYRQLTEQQRARVAACGDADAGPAEAL